MFLLSSYFDTAYLWDIDYTFSINRFTLDFWLVVLATVLIAGAGNAINDYFDIATDAINKPDRLIVDRYISRFNVMKLYLGLNIVAFVFSLIASYRTEVWLILLLHTASIAGLWFYSLKWKKKLIIGNVVVALLVATVPIYVGLLYQAEYGFFIPHRTNPFNLTNYQNFPILISICFAGFAFLLNLIREIVKDIEDVEGDRFIQAKTIPIIFGIKTARNVVISLLILFLFTFFPIYKLYLNGKINLTGFIPFFMALLLSFSVITFLFKELTAKNLKYISLGLKIVMMVGMVLPLFWMI